MVGIEGGLMAIIHLVLKRPILGLLGATGVLVVELGNYPVGDMMSKSVKTAGYEIKSARDELVAELNDVPVVKRVSRSASSAWSELGNARDGLLVELNKYKTDEVFSALAQSSESAIEDARKKTLFFLDEKMMFVAKQLNPDKKEGFKKNLDVKTETAKMQNEKTKKPFLLNGDQVAVRLSAEKGNVMPPSNEKQETKVQIPASFLK